MLSRNLPYSGARTPPVQKTLECYNDRIPHLIFPVISLLQVLEPIPLEKLKRLEKLKQKLLHFCIWWQVQVQSSSTIFPVEIIKNGDICTSEFGMCHVVFEKGMKNACREVKKKKKYALLIRISKKIF